MKPTSLHNASVIDGGSLLWNEATLSVKTRILLGTQHRRQLLETRLGFLILTPKLQGALLFFSKMVHLRNIKGHKAVTDEGYAWSSPLMIS